VDLDDRLIRLIHRQDGVISRWQALQYMSVKALEHALTSGRWRRVHRGVLLTQSGPLTPAQRAWIAVLAAAGDQWSGVCLSGLSALCGWGLRRIEPAMIDVLVPHPRQTRPPRGVRNHRTHHLPEAAPHLRPPTAPCGRSLLDAAAWARSDREATLIVAASFQQGVVTLVDVERAATEQPATRRRALVLRTARDCAGGSHSLAELDFLSLCRRFHLPEPTRQVRRFDHQGRLRFLDALFEPAKVAVEIDGAHHLDVAQMWDDAVKANALQLDGYTVLRYPAFVVRTSPQRVAAEIRAALTRAGWVEWDPL
jgi:very-short-patch-repair endonuclease